MIILTSQFSFVHADVLKKAKLTYNKNGLSEELVTDSFTFCPSSNHLIGRFVIY